MGPPAETHYCLQGCGSANYIPNVCKSHNAKEAKYMSFHPARLFPISVSQKHPSTANAASSSVQLPCPKGLPAHTLYHILDIDSSICQIADAVLSTTSEACSVFTMSHKDTEDAPMALSYCLTEKWLSLDWFLWLSLSYRTNNPRTIKTADAGY